ncbi:MAG: LPS export ABC transporter periplasmic protein LptC [bacterium]|nr:LPS export ABC transporter periplasmic protein LptC [bacterium]
MATGARIAACAILLAAGAARGQETEATPTPPGSELRDGFTFSSTRHDGRIEWKVEGSAATFLTPTLIEIDDARAVYYGEDGVNTVATSEKAILDKETRQVTTDRFVTIVTENSVTTGTGMDWDHEKKQGTIKKGVKVVYTAPEGKELLQ